jgi:hypothetical protein
MLLKRVLQARDGDERVLSSLVSNDVADCFFNWW